MAKSNQRAPTANCIKRFPLQQDAEAVRAAHAALHRFAEFLEEEIDVAIHRARARQLAPLRRILQTCHYVRQRFILRDGEQAVPRPSNLTVDADLSAGLQLINDDDLIACLDRLANLQEELVVFEDRPFAQKQIAVDKHVGMRQRTQHVEGVDVEETTLAELERIVLRLVAIFWEAVHKFAETESSETPKASAMNIKGLLAMK